MQRKEINRHTARNNQQQRIKHEPMKSVVVKITDIEEDDDDENEDSDGDHEDKTQFMFGKMKMDQK